MSQNPLYKYYRQPKIYVALPSQGNYYPENALDLPPNGEVPVFPMTAADEMKARTPDALFNGAAIADIVASCVPNIKDPWSMPVSDMNALLAAIRLASYGETMELMSGCPKCGYANMINVDLRSVLGSIKTIDKDDSFTLGDLTFNIRPLSYAQLNDINRANFFNQRNINEALNNIEATEEEKAAALGNAYRQITDMTIKTIAATISSIKTPDALVSDTAQIYEFLTNCGKTYYEEVRQNSIDIRNSSDLAPIPVICADCENEYDQPFTLDISNFFETAS